MVRRLIGHLVDHRHVHARADAARPRAKTKSAGEHRFKRRDSVSHTSFGTGTVIESTLTREGEEVTVAFPGVGIKKLLAEYLKKQ